MGYRIIDINKLCAAITLATSCTQIQAQTNSALIEEILVTSNFREENLQRTPLAISAVTNEMIRASGQTTISEVALQAPNVLIKPNSSPFGASVNASIRGTGQNDYNLGFEPGVAMYIDDVYVPGITGSNFELIDPERVEILRGPQGTLQGRNAAGGAVRLVNRKPTGTGPGFIEATSGRFNQKTTRAAGETLLAEDIALRVAFASNRRDGFIQRQDFNCAQPLLAAELGIKSQNPGSSDCTTGTLGGQDNYSGRAHLRWFQSEKMEINLVADMSNDNSQATGMVLLNAPADSGLGTSYGPWFNTPEGEYFTYETFTNSSFTVTAPYTTPPINHFNSKGLSFTVDYSLNESLAFKSITARRHFDNEFATANDGSPLNGETGFIQLSGESYQQEFRLTGNYGNLDYTVGTYYFKQENTNQNRLGTGYLGTSYDLIGNEASDASTMAVFANGVWHVSEKLNVSAGLRYSDETKDQSLVRKNATIRSGLTTSSLPGISQAISLTPAVRFSEQRVDYRLSVDYRLNENLMSYLSYSTGYKNGGASPGNVQDSTLIPFGVENVDAVEFGLKSDFFDNRLRVNATVFLNNHTDQQISVHGNFCNPLRPPGTCLATGNFADAKLLGWEVEASILASQHTLINFSASQIQANYTRISPEALANPAFITDPAAPAGVPEYQASLGIQHTFTLPAGGTFTPRLDINAESRRVPILSSVLPVPAFVAANLQTTWRSATNLWEVAGAVNNFTNEYYLLNVVDNSNIGGWAAGQPAMPRHWSLTVRYNFF